MYDKCYFCLDQLPKLKKESTSSFFVNFGGAGVQKSRPTLLYMKHILWKRVVTDQVYLKYLYCLFLCSVWNRHQNWRWWNRCWHCSKSLRWSRLHQMQISIWWIEIRNWVGVCCKTETLGNPYHDDLERWQTDTFTSSDILGSCTKVIMN